MPVVENGHERRTVFLAALAALSVTLAIAVTVATVTDGSSRRPMAPSRQRRG